MVVSWCVCSSCIVEVSNGCNVGVFNKDFGVSERGGMSNMYGAVS